MKKLLIILTLIGIFSCKKYEKKVLKVEITSDKSISFAWDNNAYGACETNGKKEIYLKEGTTLSFTALSCPRTPLHLVVKVGKNTLYDGNDVLQKVNVVVERK